MDRSFADRVLANADVFEPPPRTPTPAGGSFSLYAWYIGPDRTLARTQQGRRLILDRDRMEVLHQLVVRGFQVYGYDARGKRVDDPTRAFDFDREISTLTVINADRSWSRAGMGGPSSASSRGR